MECKEFYGYTVCEDGSIYNKHNRKLNPTRKEDGRGHRYEIRLHTDQGRKNFILTRLLYLAFNPDFDVSNKNLCVVFKDREKTNDNMLHIDNLEVQHRKDLIQGDKHYNRTITTSEVAEKIKLEYKGKPGKNQHNKTSPSYLDLAKKYGMTKENVVQIIKGTSRNKDKYKLK